MDPRVPAAPATIEPASDVLDVAVLQDLMTSLIDPVTVAAVYRKFVENASEFLRELPTQENAARVDTLHTLKGSAAMMGARRLAQLAACLQTQAATSSVQVAQAVDALADELARFRAAAAARLADLGAPL
jgi:HPt (histidine-containing phosphotransfer) domain-containing protein